MLKFPSIFPEIPLEHRFSDQLNVPSRHIFTGLHLRKYDQKLLGKASSFLLSFLHSRKPSAPRQKNKSKGPPGKHRAAARGLAAPGGGAPTRPARDRPPTTAHALLAKLR